MDNCLSIINTEQYFNITIWDSLSSLECCYIVWNFNECHWLYKWNKTKSYFYFGQKKIGNTIVLLDVWNKLVSLLFFDYL